MILAVRVPCYRPFESQAYAHIASLGIHAVEIRAPKLDALAAFQADLARHKLRATTVQIECDLARDDADQQVAAQLPILAALGTTTALLALRPLDIPRDIQYERLARICRAAGDAGVTLAAETHPDLFTNAADTLATLAAVNHSALRVNFDPANIHFYNDPAVTGPLDPIAELRRIVRHVVSVHLKDTPGGYRVRNFPALGQGCIDFPGLFKVLKDAGFSGPLTLEIEGSEGEPRTAEAIFGRMERSVSQAREFIG